MERYIQTCDRCGAQLVSDTESEIELRIVSEKTGKPELEKADLCKDCLNGLVKWFGPANPFTGKNYISY